MQLEPIVKTSGKTGLHVFVPIKRTIDFDAARHVSELVSRHLMRLHPKDITMEWSVTKRSGKIFMDHNMNVRGKTLNVAYSPRGVAGAPGVDAVDLGRIGVRASARLPPDRCYKTALPHGRSLERCPHTQTGPGAGSETEEERQGLIHRRSSHGCTFDCVTHRLLRPRRHSREAVHGDRIQGRHLLQPAAQEVRFARCATRRCARARTFPIERDEIVKGYEFAKDQYVMFAPDELKAMEEAGTHSADIVEFVPISAIDPVYFDKAYYLAPDKGGAKPYALLAKALRESEALRDRPLGRARQELHRDDPPVEDGLVMQQLLYANEVRSIERHRHPAHRRQAAELKLAQQLIDAQSRTPSIPAVQGRRRRSASRPRCSRRSRASRSPWPRNPRAARRSST
jgi:Ku protein